MGQGADCAVQSRRTTAVGKLGNAACTVCFSISTYKGKEGMGIVPPPENRMACGKRQQLSDRKTRCAPQPTYNSILRAYNFSGNTMH